MNRRNFLSAIGPAIAALVLGEKEFLSLVNRHEIAVQETIRDAGKVLDTPSLIGYWPLADGYDMGIARGDKGTALITYDGGKTWAEIEVSQFERLS